MELQIGTKVRVKTISAGSVRAVRSLRRYLGLVGTIATSADAGGSHHVQFGSDRVVFYPHELEVVTAPDP